MELTQSLLRQILDRMFHTIQEEGNLPPDTIDRLRGLARKELLRDPEQVEKAIQGQNHETS